MLESKPCFSFSEFPHGAEYLESPGSAGEVQGPLKGWVVGKIIKGQAVSPHLMLLTKSRMPLSAGCPESRNFWLKAVLPAAMAEEDRMKDL